MTREMCVIKIVCGTRNRLWYEEIVYGMENEFQKNRLWLAFKYVVYIL